MKLRLQQDLISLLPKFLEAVESPITEDDPEAVVNLKTLNKACNDVGESLTASSAKAKRMKCNKVKNVGVFVCNSCEKKSLTTVYQFFTKTSYMTLFK